MATSRIESSSQILLVAIYQAKHDTAGTHQGCLAVVDMSNDGYVTDVMLVCQNIAVSWFYKLPCRQKEFWVLADTLCGPNHMTSVG